MDLTQITDAHERGAVWVVFLNVLLQSAGKPVVPAGRPTIHCTIQLKDNSLLDRLRTSLIE